MPSNKEEIIEKGEVKNVDEDMLEKVEFLVATTSSNAASSSNNNKMSTTKKDNKGKSTSTTANKQKRPKKGRKNARKRRFSEASHDELVRKVKERYGTSTKKDELKEAILDRGNGQIHQPDSYQRMMARSVEAHLNRMLQPEPPEDLLPSNWVCAICFQPVAGPTNSCQLGELFGPYFVRLSPKCQPPEQLVPRNLLKSQREKGTNMMVENDGQPSTSAKSSRSHAVSPSGSKKRGREGKRRLPPPLSGTLDLWFHGECALASPKLFLVGGRFPNLEDQIAKCWGTSIDDSTIL